MIAVFLAMLAVLVVIYGTLSPCGMLKKEIANQSQKEGASDMYVLFGGFVNRGVDTLNPIQCLAATFQVKTQGTKALNNFLK